MNCLVDWNKLHIFVEETMGVSKCVGGLTPTQKEKFFEIKILCEVRNGKLVKYINLLT
jgi:hypothetical protein